MLYPFMTLNDNTEIVHSELLNMDGKEKVKVCIEKPVYGGFHSAVCYLPDYSWENIQGFSDSEIFWMNENHQLESVNRYGILIENNFFRSQHG